MDKATEETRGPQIMCNLEAQRSYLTWRAEKGTIRNFIFNGLDELGSKSFLNYFPEY